MQDFKGADWENPDDSQEWRDLIKEEMEDEIREQWEAEGLEEDGQERPINEDGTGYADWEAEGLEEDGQERPINQDGAGCADCEDGKGMVPAAEAWLEDENDNHMAPGSNHEEDWPEDGEEPGEEQEEAEEEWEDDPPCLEDNGAGDGENWQTAEAALH